MMSRESYFAQYASPNLVIVPTVSFSPLESGVNAELITNPHFCEHTSSNDYYGDPSPTESFYYNDNITSVDPNLNTEQRLLFNTEASDNISPFKTESTILTEDSSYLTTPHIKELSSTQYKSRNSLVDFTGFNRLTWNRGNLSAKYRDFRRIDTNIESDTIKSNRENEPRKSSDKSTRKSDNMVDKESSKSVKPVSSQSKRKAEHIVKSEIKQIASDMEEKMKKCFKELWKRNVEKLRAKSAKAKREKMEHLKEHSKSSKPESKQSKSHLQGVTKNTTSTSIRTKIIDKAKKIHDCEKSKRSKGEIHANIAANTNEERKAHLSPISVKRRHKDFQQFIRHNDDDGEAKNNTQNERKNKTEQVHDKKRRIISCENITKLKPDIKIKVVERKQAIKKETTYKERHSEVDNTTKNNMDRVTPIKRVVQVHNHSHSRFFNGEQDLRLRLSRKRAKTEYVIHSTQQSGDAKKDQGNETIRLKQDACENSKMNKPKKSKKLKVTIINIECSSSDDSEGSDKNDNEDLSFLDDIDIDEIVDSLDERQTQLEPNFNKQISVANATILLKDKVNGNHKNICNEETKVEKSMNNDSKKKSIETRSYEELKDLTLKSGSGTKEERKDNQKRKDANRGNSTMGKEIERKVDVSTFNKAAVQVKLDEQKFDDPIEASLVTMFSPIKQNVINDVTHQVSYSIDLKADNQVQNSGDPVEASLETMFNGKKNKPCRKLIDRRPFNELEKQINNNLQNSNDAVETSLATILGDNKQVVVINKVNEETNLAEKDTRDEIEFLQTDTSVTVNNFYHMVDQPESIAKTMENKLVQKCATETSNKITQNAVNTIQSLAIEESKLEKMAVYKLDTEHLCKCDEKVKTGNEHLKTLTEARTPTKSIENKTNRVAVKPPQSSGSHIHENKNINSEKTIQNVNNILHKKTASHMVKPQSSLNENDKEKDLLNKCKETIKKTNGMSIKNCGKPAASTETNSLDKRGNPKNNALDNGQTGNDKKTMKEASMDIGRSTTYEKNTKEGKELQASINIKSDVTTNQCDKKKPPNTKDIQVQNKPKTNVSNKPENLQKTKDADIELVENTISVTKENNIAEKLSEKTDKSSDLDANNSDPTMNKTVASSSNDKNEQKSGTSISKGNRTVSKVPNKSSELVKHTENVSSNKTQEQVNAKKNIIPEGSDKKDETKPDNDKKENTSFTASVEAELFHSLKTRAEVTSRIQSGRYSVVHKCRDGNGKTYALKVMRASFHHLGPEIREILFGIQDNDSKKNTSILHLISGFEVQQQYCLLTEFYPKNLDQALEENNRGFHIDLVQVLSKQLVKALNVLSDHHILHTDIKPRHILLNSTNYRLKLCGFERAGYNSDISIYPGSGSNIYRAPEIILGYPEYQNIDVWSTALVMFKMATNTDLFSGFYNSEILYQHLCTIGSFDWTMIEKSKYRHKYFSGSIFKLQTGKQESVLVHIFQDSDRLRKRLFMTYARDWSRNRTSWQMTNDLDKLETLHSLLEQMLDLNPRHRLPIEFVGVSEFLSSWSHNER